MSHGPRGAMPGRIGLALAALTLPLVPASAVHAHPLGLGALLVVERDDGAFDVSLRLSPDEAGVARPELVVGASCALAGPVARGAEDDTVTRALRMRCPAGRAELDIEGLAGSDVRVLATVRRRGAPERHFIVEPDAAHVDLGDLRPGEASFLETLWLGAEHVALGVDHLLFVLGLLFLARTPRLLFLSITGFTVGHSITLALATLGAIAAPRAPVEIAIALSLVLVALEVARPDTAEASLSRRAPWLVAGSFGLVHGLGFASALADLGLREGSLAEALLAFNLGVEAGQLAFVGAVLGALRLTIPPTRTALARSLAAHAVGGTGVYLVLDRTLTRVLELVG